MCNCCKIKGKKISFRDVCFFFFFQLIEGPSWKADVKLLPLNYESCVSFSRGKVQAGSYTFLFSFSHYKPETTASLKLCPFDHLDYATSVLWPSSAWKQKLPKLLLATTARCPRRSRSAERFVETPHLALWQSGSGAISSKMNNARCNSRKMGINKRINQLLPE